jgi:RND family efflux transporter MFP subunit
VQSLNSETEGLETAPAHAASRHDLGNTGIWLTISAVVLIAVLLVGFFVVQHRRTEEADALNEQAVARTQQAPTVDVVAVDYAPATQSVSYPGETRGWYESTVYARVNGYVEKWFADIGDRVKKGQVLATIDTPDLDAQFQAAQHQLVASQSQVDVMDANAAFAKSTYERWRDSPPGVVSEQEREAKKAEYASSNAELKAAEAKVSADKADVDQLSAMKGFKEVTAPFDGVITSRHIDMGDLVTAGSTASTSPLYTVAQISEIRVFVDVPQRAAAGMDVGVPAMATADEFPGQKFSGKIARTSDAIDPATRTLHVEVDVANPDLVLMPGMYMQVNFQLKHKNFLQVPASALISTSRGLEVAVVNDDGKVNFHNVQIAIDNGDFVEIGSGLALNDKVALNLSNQVAEGDKVVAMQVDDHGKPLQAQGAADTGQNRAVAANVPSVSN